MLVTLLLVSRNYRIEFGTLYFQIESIDSKFLVPLGGILFGL